jgi:hypothetical protein
MRLVCMRHDTAKNVISSNDRAAPAYQELYEESAFWIGANGGE